MKLTILYFAWLRTKTGMADEVVEAPDEIADVAGLIEWLKGRSEGHAEAFADSAIVCCALNMDYVEPDAAIKDGDEVGFFPPVTGG